MISITAVIVTYEAEIAFLKKLCNSLINQVDYIYIVDNSTLNPVRLGDCDFQWIKYIDMRGNVGIAKAQNVGVSAAFAAGATDIILFDQDSMPSSTMVEDLLAVREAAEKQGLRVAAVGPQQCDSRNGELSKFIYTGTFGISHIEKPIQPLSYCVASFLIASGCLINKHAWDVIGEMESDLFIDCVDIEWGFRAASKSYVCIGAFDARLSHTLGDDKINICGLSLTNHSPIRHYYYYRNFYRLVRRNYVPRSWKIHVLVKSSIQAVIFASFTNSRFSHALMIIKGIYHGWNNRGGRFQ